MRILYILLFVAFGLNSIQAQNKRHEKIKAFKTAHLTEELDLSSAEAEKFWPIYNAHEEKMAAFRRTERKEIMEPLRTNGIEDMSDEQANRLIDISMELESNRLAERKNLIRQLRAVLSPKKIIKLRKAEEDFKKKLLDRYRDRRRDKKNRP